MQIAVAISEGGEAAWLQAMVEEQSHGLGQELEERGVALDGLWKAGEIAPPNIVKLDVEGADLAALRDMGELTAASRPHFLIEFHGASIDGQDMDTLSRRLLLELGYELTTLRCGEVHALLDRCSRRTPGQPRLLRNFVASGQYDPNTDANRRLNA
ncbi:MAG: FkbM family methyltransferase [Gemmatimonadaceae bacterium]